MVHAPNAYAVDIAITVLNEALKQDPRAIRDLRGHRELCNQRLAQNDTVQVREDEDGVKSVGVLGLINGILGTLPNGSGPVSAELDDVGNVVRFVKRSAVAGA